MIRDLSDTLAMKSGRTTYDTVSDVFRLDDFRSTQRHRAEDLIVILPGENKHMINVIAPPRFGKQLLSNIGDGTRGRREYCVLTGYDLFPILGGNCFSSDVSKWPTHPGVVLPIYFDDLVTLMDLVHEYNALSHEFDTELLRSISNPSTPILVHTIYPEPHSGKSGALHFKMWMKFIESWHEARLCVVIFNNDCCSTGLSATKILMTVTDKMISAGVTYIGLPSPDFQYFAPYLEPKVIEASPDGDQAFLPPPKIGGLDPSHHVRTVRRNGNDDKIAIVFSTERGVGGEEAYVSYNFKYIKQLARDRRFRDKYNLHEISTFDDVIDQKGDASWDLFSWKMINLLERHAEKDKGTILALKATYYIVSPWKIKGFTNPFQAVYFLWRGLAIWETQERYVKLIVKNLSLHCPSPQMRESNRILAHAMILLVLATFLHKQQCGDIQDWSDFGAIRANSDVVEQLHSEERTGGLLASNHSDSVNMKEHTAVMGKLQQLFDRRPRLEAAGVKSRGAKRNAKTWHGDLGLGLPPGLVFSDICYSESSPIQIPEKYNDLVTLLEEIRRAAYADGLADYWSVFPEVKSAFEQINKCPTSVEDRLFTPKVPANGVDTDWLCTGDDITDFEVIDACIKPDYWHERLSPISACEDDGSRHAEPVVAPTTDTCGRQAEQPTDADRSSFFFESAKVISILEKAVQDRTEIAKLADEAKDKKSKTFVAGEGPAAQVITWNKLLSGDVLLDSEGATIKTSQAMRLYQLRDYHARGRLERFWVGRLRSYAPAVKDGHDTTLGSVLLVRWGGRNDQFAVVRVMGIIQDGEKANSCKLVLSPQDSTKAPPKSARNQVFQVELMDPTGPATESGSQKYTSSGWFLPKLTANMVIKSVQLLHLAALAEPGHSTHDALLCLEDIVALYKKGFKRVSRQDGYLHIETQAEQVQNLDSSVMWDAQVSEHACLICQMSHFDDVTGLVVQCQKCLNAWHQECHPIKIKLEDALAGSWECGVCSGQVKDVCCHCHGDWEDPDDDNLLYYCEGTCGRLWHAKCHSPPIELGGNHAVWRCTPCAIKQAEAEEEAMAQHQPATIRPSRACKNTHKGLNDVSHARVHGIPVPGMRISDPSTTRLGQGTWDQNYVHAGSNKAAPTRKERQPNEELAPSALEYKCLMCERYQTEEFLTIDMCGNYNCSGAAAESCHSKRKSRRRNS